MRSTQVAAAWVPSLFQGPESQPPPRHKFLKLLISNGVSSGSAVSPVAMSPSVTQRSATTHLSKSESTELDESSSGETDSGSAFSSPEAVQPVSQTRLGAGNASPSSNHVHATLARPLPQLTVASDGVQDVLIECRAVMQACFFLVFLAYSYAVANAHLFLPFLSGLCHIQPRT
jgi:hypothetical protein